MAVAGMESVQNFAPDVKDWLAEIAKNRNPDGTYGKGDGQARETGGIVAMILRSGNSLSEEHRKGVIAALQAGQRDDGGFGKADSKSSDAETTYRVMRAFYLLKEKPKDVAKLKEFIGKCRNSDGGYGVAPGQRSTVSGTYFAAVVGYWLEK
jgi:prenyltransferase beta subunit